MFFRFGIEAVTPGPILWIPVGVIKADNREEACRKLKKWTLNYSKDMLDELANVPPSRRGNPVACFDHGVLDPFIYID